MNHTEELRQYEAKRLAVFWSRVAKYGVDECWLWQGHADDDGYGLFSFHNEEIRAARFVMEVWLGARLNEEDCVLHRCDNPPCVNPRHLFIGTIQDNNADCVSKGRQARQKGSKNGSAKLTEYQVREILALLESGRRQIELAKMFGVSKQTISAVKCNRHWRHINVD